MIPGGRRHEGPGMGSAPSRAMITCRLVFAHGPLEEAAVNFLEHAARRSLEIRGSMPKRLAYMRAVTLKAVRQIRLLRRSGEQSSLVRSGSLAGGSGPFAWHQRRSKVAHRGPTQNLPPKGRAFWAAIKAAWPAWRTQ